MPSPDSLDVTFGHVTDDQPHMLNKKNVLAYDNSIEKTSLEHDAEEPEIVNILTPKGSSGSVGGQTAVPASKAKGVDQSTGGTSSQQHSTSSPKKAQTNITNDSPVSPQRVGPGISPTRTPPLGRPPTAPLQQSTLGSPKEGIARGHPLRTPPLSQRSNKRSGVTRISPSLSDVFHRRQSVTNSTFKSPSPPADSRGRNSLTERQSAALARRSSPAASVTTPNKRAAFSPAADRVRPLYLTHATPGHGRAQAATRPGLLDSTGARRTGTVVSPPLQSWAPSDIQQQESKPNVGNHHADIAAAVLETFQGDAPLTHDDILGFDKASQPTRKDSPLRSQHYFNPIDQTLAGGFPRPKFSASVSPAKSFYQHTMHLQPAHPTEQSPGSARRQTSTLFSSAHLAGVSDLPGTAQVSQPSDASPKLTRAATEVTVADKDDLAEVSTEFEDAINATMRNENQDYTALFDDFKLKLSFDSPFAGIPPAKPNVNMQTLADGSVLIPPPPTAPSSVWGQSRILTTTSSEVKETTSSHDSSAWDVTREVQESQLAATGAPTESWSGHATSGVPGVAMDARNPMLQFDPTGPVDFAVPRGEPGVAPFYGDVNQMGYRDPRSSFGRADGSNMGGHTNHVAMVPDGRPFISLPGGAFSSSNLTGPEVQDISAGHRQSQLFPQPATTASHPGGRHEQGTRGALSLAPLHTQMGGSSTSTYMSDQSQVPFYTIPPPNQSMNAVLPSSAARPPPPQIQPPNLAVPAGKAKGLVSEKGGNKDRTATTGTRAHFTPLNIPTIVDRDANEMRPVPTDPAQKRSELVESPHTKQAYKAFFRQLRVHQRGGFEQAQLYAQENLHTLPEKVHWRVYLELADVAKRENQFKTARKLFRKVTQLQPFASQGWLEYAKTEEECGELMRCHTILSRGLMNCPMNEALLVKGIKHQERMGNIPGARVLLSKLKSVSIDKAWRTILEGALLEGRAGNEKVARKIFKYLIEHVPWYGPIYHEAYRFEEKCEDYRAALKIVRRGLKEIPRYGPLWFSAFRLLEQLSPTDLTPVRQTIERATVSISKELLWKVYFEAAQIEERGGHLDLARQAYVKSVIHCPTNLRWKIWLGGARTELIHGFTDRARALLAKAMQEVPKKTRALVLLESSRLEEFDGKIDRAREILAQARASTRSEWKVFLESVLLETRAGRISEAIEQASMSLEMHFGTGRLWAVYIRLVRVHGVSKQLEVFRQALTEVPKSGEVWCEGARVFLDPTSPKFNLAKARQFLDFAVQFTPQYGDSFLEYLRLELLEKGMEFDDKRLMQMCVNADPNYGAMWFHCKSSPLQSTRSVFRAAKALLIDQLTEHRAVYQRAIVRTQAATTFDKPKAEVSNDVPTCFDFSTGFITLNRMSFNLADLSNEDRRKIIFGSDYVSL